MRFLKYIIEEYVGYWPEKNPADLAFPVFKNPTWKELKELGGACRFIVDDWAKNIFVSKVNFYHPDFLSYLERHRHIRFDDEDNCFMGSGEIVNGKIKIDTVSKDYLVPGKIARFVWAEKYFTNLDKYIKKYDLKQYHIKE
jgi:hypothetical protein